MMKSAPEIVPIEEDPISIFQKVNNTMVRDMYRPTSGGGMNENSVTNVEDTRANDFEVVEKQSREQDIIVHVLENDARMQHYSTTNPSDNPMDDNNHKFVISPTLQVSFGIGNQNTNPFLVGEDVHDKTQKSPQPPVGQNSTILTSPSETDPIPVHKKLPNKKSSKNLSLFDVIIGRKSRNSLKSGSNFPEESEKQKRKRTICGCQIPLKWYQILTAIGWIIMMGVSLWYSINSIMNYVETNNNPTTSLSYVEKVPLPFPVISICNWNAKNTDCSYCGLKLEKIFRADIQKEVPEYFQKAEYKEIRQDDSLFRCYIFNNHSSNIVTANYTGYTGSLSFFFRVPIPSGVDLSDYSRVGLQVSFHENGTMPDLVAETNFAVPRRDNYFMLTNIITTRLRTTEMNPVLVDVRWEPFTSNVELIGANETLVVISVAYATLNVNYITEVVTSSLESLFGEIAGFLGLTMGLDMLKVLRGILDVPYSIKDRTLMNLWNTFN